ncbi:inactive ubiquitin carboxyl-terminal hydrolase 53-like [Papaver somniferum]|uniref:inactive ubiquitin carboxyl-terminal hydrolase 53-like n=1 Tax=Papaver somniferum TaxID=3469 RepID=UPI000E7033F7|nr:inactive ubiquitin carboxyl-terminal hydrolase 53-like [Papaver somniferum]
MLGKGLQNKAAESNCFLNVIIQARKSLWHLKPLRENFPRSHNHVGDPCAVCALSDIFTAFSSPSTMQTEAVDPAGLRVALSKLDIENFQQGQMNDASEVLMLILDCLHESITSDLGDTESNCTCIIHSQFGIKISEQFKCYKCPADQTNPPSTSFMHTINAKVLRTLKILCGEISFGQLLKRAELNLQSECDCGKPNYTNKLLSTPHVFTAFLVWERDPSAMDITATLGALTTELDIAYLYQGIDVGHMYQLVSMVCFSAPHYYCFIQSRDQERWTMYDDSNVMEIGGWDEVIQQCQGRGSQPNVLFFEADTNNCFLNVIIQSLWHLKPLRENFPRSHEHVGNPCAVCAVSDIFTAFSSLSTMQTEAVDPTILSRLRVALSNLSPDKKNFQQGQMNDATEVLMLILDCLHKSLTSDLSDTESNCTCIAHSQFGIKISEQFKCYKCSAERTNSLPTSFMHNISAKVLRSFKSICGDISFGQLLKLSELNHQSACPCGKPKYTNKLLSTPPHVFTAVLDWESTWESADDLSATLEAPTTELDVAYLYRGINVGSEYHLVSMVCFSARDYYCFTRRQQKQWTVYDSISVKVIGNWDDVVHKCEESHSLPRVVFFEAILQS